jgi:2-haloacid dehalogenase
MAGPPDHHSSHTYIFDAFGTLFDVHAVARQHAAALGSSADQLSAIWRAKQLEYTWFHAARCTHVPFRDLTCDALFYAFDKLELSRDLAPVLLESYRRMSPFADVVAALQRLKTLQARLAILSNADPDMLDDLVEAAELTDVFDSLLTVSAAGTFKPAPAVYALACKVLARPAADMTFVSSNRWDIAGAKASGFHTVWLNRSGEVDEYTSFGCDRVIRSLAAL